jgi:hypothetical protein
VGVKAQSQIGRWRGQAVRWRGRAEELRVIAEAMIDHDAKSMMLEVAVSYDSLADWADDQAPDDLPQEGSSGVVGEDDRSAVVNGPDYTGCVGGFSDGLNFAALVKRRHRLI